MLSTLACLVALVPQGGAAAETATTVGSVVDAAGAPVAGAQVRFLSRQIPRALVGEQDRRVVTTDDRGRFRVELLEGECYTAWASWSGQATTLVEGVQGGEFLELRGSRGTDPFVVRVEGLQAWPDSAQFTVRALVGGENVEFVACPRDGEVFRAPPLPPIRLRAIEVLDGRGEVLAARSAQDLDGEFSIDIDEPLTFPVEVVDAQGAPLAGAEVRWHIRNYWYTESDTVAGMQRFRTPFPLVATTDEHGEADVRVPESAMKTLLLVTSKPGYRMSIDGFKGGAIVNNGKTTDGFEGPPQLRISLNPSEPASIDLRDDGVPQAEGYLRMGLRITIKTGNGSYGTIMPFDARIEGGRAVFPSPLPTGTGIEVLETRLSKRARQALRERHGFAPRLWRLAEPERFEAWTDFEDPLALRGARPVQVVTPDGRPAARVGVLYRDARSATMGVRTDRVGRALLPGGLPAGGPVGSCSTAGFAARALDDDGRVELKLQPMLPLLVRVRVDGRPPGEPMFVHPTGLTPQGESDVVTWVASQGGSLRTGSWSDRDGVVRVLLPPVAGDVSFRSNRKIVDGDHCSWNPGDITEHELSVAPR